MWMTDYGTGLHSASPLALPGRVPLTLLLRCLWMSAKRATLDYVSLHDWFGLLWMCATVQVVLYHLGRVTHFYIDRQFFLVAT